MCVCVCMCLYVCMCVCVYIYIYIYWQLHEMEEKQTNQDDEALVGEAPYSPTSV
jgi:hypothetical protein